MPADTPDPMWGRLLTAMVTPFDDDMKVDYSRSRALAKRLLDQGSDGVVVCGSTGEGPTVSATEKLRLFSEIKKEIGTAGAVIANTGNNNTADSVEMTRAAEAVGVDGVMAVVPYYNNPPQEGLYRHFLAIAESTRLPVILYNVPSRSPRNLEATTVVRLARDCPNVTALKEAKRDHAQIEAVIRDAPSGFMLYSGEDAMTLDVLERGGAGIISVASHIVGLQMKEMIDAFVAGRRAEAREMERSLLPIYDALFATTNPILVKEALRLAGFDCGAPRLPLVEATGAERDALRQALSGALAPDPIAS